MRTYSILTEIFGSSDYYIYTLESDENETKKSMFL